MLEIIFNMYHGWNWYCSKLSCTFITEWFCAHLAVCFVIRTECEYSESSKWSQLLIKRSGCWTGGATLCHVHSYFAFSGTSSIQHLSCLQSSPADIHSFVSPTHSFLLLSPWPQFIWFSNFTSVRDIDLFILFWKLWFGCCFKFTYCCRGWLGNVHPK
jgi:hypothetical protein